LSYTPKRVRTDCTRFGIRRSYFVLPGAATTPFSAPKWGVVKEELSVAGIVVAVTDDVVLYWLCESGHLRARRSRMGGLRKVVVMMGRSELGRFNWPFLCLDYTQNRAA